MYCFLLGVLLAAVAVTRFTETGPLASTVFFSFRPAPLLKWRVYTECLLAASGLAIADRELLRVYIVCLQALRLCGYAGG